MPSREGGPAVSIRIRVSPSPSKIPYRRVFPSTASNGPSMATFDDIPRLKCRPHSPYDSVLSATAVLGPRSTRSPKGFPVVEPLGSMWHDSQQCQHVHPEALGSPAGSVVPSGHRLLRPHPPLWISPPRLRIPGRGCCTQGRWLGVGIQGSPLTPLDCARVPPPIPRWPRRVHMTVASSSVLAFTPMSRVRRPHSSFRACTIDSELNSCSYHGLRVG